ncbi:MAG: hypothetical protein IKT34_03840 [Clostridia bacterium]|nr:hypothetical protein [Clostridia bacterium]
MGKRKNFRFPQGINETDRFYYPRRSKSNGSSPTNYVTDIFGLNDMESRADVLGSYTGTPTDGNDLIPIQDADDL